MVCNRTLSPLGLAQPCVDRSWATVGIFSSEQRKLVTNGGRIGLTDYRNPNPISGKQVGALPDLP
jgi:hypothetical protein